MGELEGRAKVVKQLGLGGEAAPAPAATGLTEVGPALVEDVGRVELQLSGVLELLRFGKALIGQRIVLRAEEAIDMAWEELGMIMLA